MSETTKRALMGMFLGLVGAFTIWWAYQTSPAFALAYATGFIVFNIILWSE